MANEYVVVPKHFGAALVRTGDGSDELIPLLLWFDPGKVCQLLRVGQIQPRNASCNTSIIFKETLLREMFNSEVPVPVVVRMHRTGTGTGISELIIHI
jgi:hypothetical protein